MLIKECKYRSLGHDSLIRTKHFHTNTVEIMQLVSGMGNYIIHDSVYPMQEGAVYFIDGEKFHSSHPVSDKAYCRSMVSVDKSTINSLLSEMGAKDAVDKLISAGVIFNRKHSQEIDSIFAKMAEEHSKGNDFGASLCVMEIINILSLSKSSPKADKRNSIVNAALEYINSNLSEQFTEEDICNVLHVSQSSLCHTFKEQIKIPLMEYVRIQRYLLSRDILKNTDKSIAETAYLCGFGSSSHFCSFFKKMSGITPARYRRSVQN